MTQINPNINYNMYQNQVQNQPVRIPNYYAASTFEHPGFKETLEENPMYDMFMKPFVEHPWAVLASWLVLGLGLDAYSQACSGKYEDSLPAKAGRFGDRIQHSKLIQNKPVQAVIHGLGSVKKAGGKAVQNSAILRAMRDTPTMPEWGMVKTQMFNQKQEVVQDFIRIAEALKLNDEGAPTLKNIGLTSYEKDMLKKKFNVKRISEIPETKAVNQVLLERLGRTPEQIKKIQALGDASSEAVKKEILKDMGLTKDKLKLIKEDVYGEYIKDVKIACEKVRGRVKMGAGHYSLLGPLTKPFERTIGCDEVYNKLHSMSKEGTKTATGRFCSKMMQMFHRGITFGGGKLGALIFIAPVLVEVAMNVKKADKDQKIGTAANGLVENVSWVFTFPIALKMMHALGGIKYAGMSKENVEKVRTLTKKFNEQNGSGFIDRLKGLFGKSELKPSEFKTHAEYKIEKNKVKTQIKDLSKVEGQNIFTKGLRKIAGLLTPDLGNLRGYHGGNIASKFIHDLPHLGKDAFGIPLRFGVWGLLSMGVLGAALTKCTTAIFGKSYDAMKQDEHNDSLKTQKQFLKDDLNDRLVKLAREKQNASSPVQNNNIKSNPQAIPVSRGKDANSGLIPDVQIQENKIDNYTYIPSSKNIIPQPVKNNKLDNYTYIPSSECKIKTDSASQDNKRRYIPSQAAANIQKSFDNSGLQSALDRAQKAEDKALRVLAGNFQDFS